MLSAEKKLAQNIDSLKVNRSESGAPITTPIPFEGGFFCLGAATANEEDGCGIGAPFPI